MESRYISATSSMDTTVVAVFCLEQHIGVNSADCYVYKAFDSCNSRVWSSPHILFTQHAFPKAFLASSICCTLICVLWLDALHSRVAIIPQSYKVPKNSLTDTCLGMPVGCGPRAFAAQYKYLTPKRLGLELYLCFRLGLARDTMQAAESLPSRWAITFYSQSLSTVPYHIELHKSSLSL